MIRIVAFWRLYWGPPSQGNYHVCAVKRFLFSRNDCSSTELGLASVRSPESPASGELRSLV